MAQKTHSIPHQTLFIKYVSDKFAGHPHAPVVVPAGATFTDLVALKGDPNIGEKMNVLIHAVADKNPELQGAINVADFNDPDKLGKGAEMQKRLSNLVAIFENPALDFSHNQAEGDDILGDAYEYLMRHFATESGKSKGQFYTPAEVSRVIAKLIGTKHAHQASQTLYDPTCGSGSLLLKAADESPVDITIYGQEMDNATRALAIMNMYLHNHPTAEIWQDNTLVHPHWTQPDGSLKTFDFAVANPPFSSKAWSSGLDPRHDQYNRFGYGIPPEKNGDYAFLLHVLASLKSTGKGAIILPHGVLFRGNAEADLRRAILKKGYIKGIIGLPPNLFYGTGIPACIIVLDKENAPARTGIFMIDASRGYMKDGNKNRLRHQDIHKIVDVFNNRRDMPKYARMVSFDEIAANDYNLNISRYIDSSEPEDRQDIAAHLLGGIPNSDLDALGDYWDVFPALSRDLFDPADRPGYSQLKLVPAQVKPTILNHPEFVAYKQRLTALFEQWRAECLPLLTAITLGTQPKPLIEALSEGLLRHFADVPLLDSYDLYQHLMTYWADVMQDDVYLIAVSDWQAAKALRLIVEEKAKEKGNPGSDNGDSKEKKNKETPDLTVGKLKYKADLIPVDLVIARYFAAEQQAIEQYQAEIDSAVQAMEALREEHGVSGEGECDSEAGLLAEVSDDKGKINRNAINARLKQLKGLFRATDTDSDSTAEADLLNEYLTLLDREADAKKHKTDAEAVLMSKLFAQYQALDVDQAKALVIDDKWLATIAGAVQGEIDRVSQTLAGRVKQLAERYAAPLPILTARVDELSAKVDEHLNRMGYSWN